MADAAIGIDHGFLTMVCFCTGLMLVQVMTKMPVGRSRFFMLAISSRSRPAELERQKHQEKNQTKPPHEEFFLNSSGGWNNARRHAHAAISRSSLLEIELGMMTKRRAAVAFG